MRNANKLQRKIILFLPRKTRKPTLKAQKTFRVFRVNFFVSFVVKFTVNSSKGASNQAHPNFPSLLL
jgi:hypothetical protein